MHVWGLFRLALVAADGRGGGAASGAHRALH